MSFNQSTVFSVVGGEAEHQIDRKELQEKLMRMELYFNRVYKRLEELDLQLAESRKLNTDQEETIRKGLLAMNLSSEKESIS